MQLYADYSAGKPGGAALRAAGFSGVHRYLPPFGTAGKQLTSAEYADLTAHGLEVIGVVEVGINDADGGYAAGQHNAAIAASSAAELGMPADCTICAANDKPGYSAADVDYVRGFRDTLGFARTGAYGYGAFLGLCAPYAAYRWQAGPAPSRTGTSALASAWQRNGTPGNAADGAASPSSIVVAGIACDVSNVYMEEDMALDPGQMLVGYNADGSSKPESLGNLLGLLEAIYQNISGQGGWLAAQLRALPGMISDAQAAVVAALPPAGSAATVTDAQMADLEAKLVAALPAGWNVAITPKADTPPAS